MLRELAANAHKEGWDSMSRKQHFDEIDYHLAKLKSACEAGDLNRILEYGADVGNHVWFLLEFEDVLTPERIAERWQEPEFQQAQRPTYMRLLRRSWRHPRWWRKAWRGLTGPEYARDGLGITPDQLDGIG